MSCRRGCGLKPAFLRRPMSTVGMAPERPPLPLNGNKSSGQRPRVGFLPRQVICVFALVLTDLFAIGISLELAILARRYFVPHVDAHVEFSTFPFLHYLS